jgi:hypothetical protein
MSRSWRHGKHNIEKLPWWKQPWNKEWWSRRPYSMTGPLRHANKWLKRRVHKRERRDQEINDD